MPLINENSAANSGKRSWRSWNRDEGICSENNASGDGQCGNFSVPILLIKVAFIMTVVAG